MPNDVFNGLGVKVNPLARDEFLKVRETLTRIGALLPPKTLYQTCFILHKRGEYAVMHHHEMRKLDGEDVTLSEDDLAHRDVVASLLDQWGLLEIKNPVSGKRPTANITVIPHKDKSRYELKPYYEIGKPRS